MPPGGRGRGGKFSKPTRGGKSALLHNQNLYPLTQPAGGKKFSKNLTPLDADGNPVGMWAVRPSFHPTP